jgi:hypothetical protein
MTVDVHAYKTRSEASYENCHGRPPPRPRARLVYVVNVQRSSEEDLFSDYRAFDHQVHGDGSDVIERHIAELSAAIAYRRAPTGEPLRCCWPSVYRVS